MKELGFVQLNIDVALFVAYGDKGQVICVIGVHVDDVIGGDDGKQGKELREKLGNAFMWGSWEFNDFVYC
eukprot:7543354-Karenia_brevis.AAC.1